MLREPPRQTALEGTELRGGRSRRRGAMCCWAGHGWGAGPWPRWFDRVMFLESHCRGLSWT